MKVRPVDSDWDDPGQTRFGQVRKSAVEIECFTYGFRDIDVRQWGEGATLRIGSFCSVAPGVRIILGGNHRVDWARTFPFGHIFEDRLGGAEIKGDLQSNGDVVIGHDVWIGQGGLCCRASKLEMAL